MRLNYLAKAIGLTMIYIGVVTLTPIITALYYHDFNSELMEIHPIILYNIC